MSVKPEGLFGDIKTKILKFEFQYFYLHFILSIKYQTFNCIYYAYFHVI